MSTRRDPFRLHQLTRREALSVLAGTVGAGLVDLPATTPAAAQGRGASAVTFPRGSIIRGILKDLDPASIAPRATLVHEHPGLSAPDDLDLLVTELKQAMADGVGCIVDSATGRRTPAQVEHIRRASAASGMPIVLGGAYYLQPRYPKELATMSEDQIADQFVQDAAAQNWGALGEFGSSETTHGDERKVLRAAGKAHVRTGLPIFTHTPHSSCPRCALEQLDIFESVGVDPRHVVIGHLSAIKDEDDPTSETHKAIAKRGAFIGLDTMGHEMSQSFIPEAKKVTLVKRLLDAGCESQLIFSSDFANPKHLKSNWGMGFATVLTQFGPKLRYAGVKDETIRRITVDNPRRFLAFVPKAK
jgi:phosphotriesterase-related protein